MAIPISACGDGPAGPEDEATVGRTSAAEIWTSPRERDPEAVFEEVWGDYAIEFIGPDTLTVRTDSFQNITGFEARTGYAFVDSLLAGSYTARLGPLDPDRFVVIHGSAEFDATPTDTASVTFVLAPLVATLAIGDTAAGPLPEPDPWRPHGYRIPVEAGDTLDVRLAVGEYASDFGYFASYSATLYHPDRLAHDGRAFHEGAFPHERTTIWPRIPVLETGTLDIVVAPELAGRGQPPLWYGLSVRKSGPILRAYPEHRLLSGPWGQAVEDTIWVWNGVPGTAQWSAFSEDARISFLPDGGDLPVFTGEPPVNAPPEGAQPVVVRILDDGERPWSTIPVQLRAGGDDWGMSEIEIETQLHDPRFSTGVELDPVEGSKAFHEVVLHPDGSAIVGSATGELQKVDLATGVAIQLPRVGDGNLDLEIGPDGSVYVLLQKGRQELWRISPDGSTELLIQSEDFSPTNNHVMGLAVTVEGAVYLSTSTSDGEGDGLWVLLPDGTPEYLGKPDPSCCEYIRAIADDPGTGRVYLAIGASPVRMVAYDPVDGTFIAFSPSPEQAYSNVNDLTVGASGRVYGTGDLGHPNSVFTFDPTTDTWGDPVIGPRTLSGITVGEGRLLTIRAPDNWIEALPVDDGPGT